MSKRETLKLSKIIIIIWMSVITWNDNTRVYSCICTHIPSNFMFIMTLHEVFEYLGMFSCIGVLVRLPQACKWLYLRPL